MRGEGAMEKAKNALQRGKEMALQASEAVTDAIEKRMSGRTAAKSANKAHTGGRRRPAGAAGRRTTKGRKASTRRRRSR
jgi:hypothetical protein